MIDLKTHTEPFQATLDGAKTFEWRREDRPEPFAVGDKLRLREFIPCERCNGTGRVFVNPDFDACSPCNNDHGEYTGRETVREVLYILRDRFNVPSGYVVMAIGPELKKRTMCTPCLCQRHSKCTAAPEGDCGCPECYVAANRTAGIEGGD